MFTKISFLRQKENCVLLCMIQLKTTVYTLLTIITTCWISGIFTGCQTQEESRSAPNVLFIAIDDLRPELGCYGENHMVTPNLDRLAANGRLFTRHYTQAPTCGVSRYSLLTGLRPLGRNQLNNNVLRNRMIEMQDQSTESMAHMFRENGYYTAALGKISHYPDGKLYSYDGEVEGEWEMPRSWDEQWGPVGKWKTAWNAFFGYSDGSNRNMAKGEYPAFEAAEVADTAFPDGLIAEKAIETLQKVKDQPFFLAVGFFKPHLPMTAPKRYWDLYDSAKLEISPNPELPEGLNEQSIQQSGEMPNNYDHPEEFIPGKPLSTAYAKQLRHAYFACVSYVDAQVGKVLDELERLGLDENTIVVVWGDHGWHLGDHTLWAKHTTFERALRSAFIVKSPGMGQPGIATDAIVETVDIYPTLAELCGLKAPEQLGGESFAHVMSDPSSRTQNETRAIGYWRNRITLRTEDYRIAQYIDGSSPETELFDHRTDPLETRNVADEHPEIVAQLLPVLEEEITRWKEAEER